MTQSPEYEVTPIEVTCQDCGAKTIVGLPYAELVATVAKAVAAEVATQVHAKSSRLAVKELVRDSTTNLVTHVIERMGVNSGGPST